jgi:hypothetical protein
MEKEVAAKIDLEGVLLDYQYPGETGPHYVVAVHGDTIDFASPWPGETLVKPAGPVDHPAVSLPGGGVFYRGRKIQDGLYLVHWIVNGEIHVSLLFDFVNKKTICAALMPGKTELWDEAHWDRWVLPSEALKIYQGNGKPQ